MTLPEVLFAHGFSINKLRLLRRFVGDSKVRPTADPSQLPGDATLLLWGADPVPAGLSPGVAVIRVEDGFLRSVGLGAALTNPVSWVLDTRGIYYDATRESDLEHILQNTVFRPELLERAARLRRRIVESGITKYNIGHGEWTRPANRTRVVLVAGQVESDASLRLGAPAVRTNLELLRTVRAASPDAYILYKPHPDVVAGIRAHGTAEADVRQWCDEVITHVPIHLLLKAVDEVHVMTSLAGFEALLRHKQVFCHGLPFYAGWGLTHDALGCPRRTRRLSLDELVAGALIGYPVYASRAGRRRTRVEDAVEELQQWRQSSPRASSVWQFLCRPLLRFAANRQ